MRALANVLFFAPLAVLPVLVVTHLPTLPSVLTAAVFAVGSREHVGGVLFLGAMVAAVVLTAAGVSYGWPVAPVLAGVRGGRAAAGRLLKRKGRDSNPQSLSTHTG
jgi:hypothetical protein